MKSFIIKISKSNFKWPITVIPLIVGLALTGFFETRMIVIIGALITWGFAFLFLGDGDE